jgi:plastocyanin
MRHSRQLVAAGTALVCLAAIGCSKKKDDGGTVTQSKPVTLSGTVTDKGTKDLAGKADFELEQDDFYFSPTFIKAAPGTTVKVELRNEGKNPHTFTIDALKIDKTLQPGDEIDVPVAMPASGALAFYCKFHQGQGMQGALFSKEGDAPATGSGGGAATPTSSGSGDNGGAYGG